MQRDDAEQLIGGFAGDALVKSVPSGGRGPVPRPPVELLKESNAILSGLFSTDILSITSD